VVGVVTAIEQARGGQQVFPQRNEHPGDLEPLIAALVMWVVDTAAIGVAVAGKLLPVPALTRHATVVMVLLDSQPRIKRALRDRIGPTGTDLVLAGTSALLHAATQSPTVPTLNAAAAIQRVLEVSARRSVWQRREPELCRPEADGAQPAADGTQPAGGARTSYPIEPPGERPALIPPGPVESYLSWLGPSSLAAAMAVLGLTRQPGRSGDMLKGLSPKAALHGRESFAAMLDMLMCRRGVLPMDGSAYRRLDRVDAVVLDSDVLCSGPPVVLEALFDGRKVVGTVTVAAELDPLAEAVVKAVGVAGHRLVLTEHVGVRELAGMANEIAPADEPFVETVRRLQGAGHVVLAVSADESTGLMAADVGVAVLRPRRPPAWGADLVTRAGLGDVWRLIEATTWARTVSERAVAAAVSGNVLGGLLAAVGSPHAGQRSATKPGKTATAFTMVLGTVSALRCNAQTPPDARQCRSALGVIAHRPGACRAGGSSRLTAEQT
jgi:cation-transporting P-type ATPase I